MGKIVLEGKLISIFERPANTRYGRLECWMITSPRLKKKKTQEETIHDMAGRAKQYGEAIGSKKVRVTIEEI